ncbi:DUF397 domain-containing protein [Streptomyces sp. NPDC020096]
MASTSSTKVAFEAAWFKSSSSGQNNGNCVEVADLTSENNLIAIRDSKDKAGPALLVTPAAWSTFISDVRAGRYPLG